MWPRKTTGIETLKALGAAELLPQFSLSLLLHLTWITSELCHFFVEFVKWLVVRTKHCYPCLQPQWRVSTTKVVAWLRASVSHSLLRALPLHILSRFCEKYDRPLMKAVELTIFTTLDVRFVVFFDSIKDKNSFTPPCVHFITAVRNKYWYVDQQKQRWCPVLCS